MTGVNRIIQGLKLHPCKVHVTGVSSAKALNELRKAVFDFPSLTTEISTSHLFFSSKDIADGDTRFKDFPPIRDIGNCLLLWDLLK